MSTSGQQTWGWRQACGRCRKHNKWTGRGRETEGTLFRLMSCDQSKMAMKGRCGQGAKKIGFKENESPPGLIKNINIDTLMLFF